MAVSVAWWTAALWPVPERAPAWLQTARAVCFGAVHDGLPDTGGWILLVGEPLGMLAALLVVWRGATTAALRRLVSTRAGRAAASAVVALLAVGLAAAGVRVAGADGELPGGVAADAPAGAPARRLDRPAPPLGLVDQHGAVLDLERFRGRPVLVTFAYAHCETVCPLLVRDALEAQRRLGGEPAVVVVSLDPWRDVPSRLPRVAEAWGLGPDAFVASGEVAEVERVLDAWEVPRSRDPRTGEVVHPPLAFVVGPGGDLAFAAAGPAERLAELVRRASRGGG